MKARGFIFLGVGAVVVMVPFLIFVLAGWPGEPNSCLSETPDTCFCELIDRAAVTSGAPGVRQPVNTWFNLYALLTAGLVALIVTLDRRRASAGAPSNLMRSDTLMPDVYIFAVLFLGLGSMWFHASITQWGGVFDGLSMYIYAAFLIFYSIRRFWNNAMFFWIGYLVTIAGFTSLHNRIPSVVLIGILVVAYLAIEVVIWVRTGKVMQGKLLTVVLWVGAVIAILLATLFWALSQTGGSMCTPTSSFQPHGLLWHPLAGVMAVLLYFYWREADDPV
jgi:hypothetical protein